MGLTTWRPTLLSDTSEEVLPLLFFLLLFLFLSFSLIPPTLITLIFHGSSGPTTRGPFPTPPDL